MPPTDEPALQPWPDCLGIFDEESCRFFLRELGQRVVRFYPFSVGIEEVYSQIVHEYGLEGAPDALSVLHELLEEDHISAGAGDDADIWRSWRHRWRHRNDDILNPCVPRVNGRFLPPPTSTRIRLLKNDNFVARQINQSKININKVDLIPATSSEEGFALLAHEEICLPQSPETMPHHARTSSSHQISSSDSIRMLSPSSELDSNDHNFREPSSERSLFAFTSQAGRTKTKSPAVSSPKLMRNSLPTFSFPFRIGSLEQRHRNSPAVAESSSLRDGDVVSEQAFTPLASIAFRPARSPCSLATDIKPPLATKQSTLPVSTQELTYVRQSLPSDCEFTQQEETRPNGQRTAHREVRMIDGALFHRKHDASKLDKSDIVYSSTPSRADNNVKGVTRREDKTRHSCKESWWQIVTARFQANRYHRRSTPSIMRKPKASFANCGIGSNTRRDTPAASSQDATQFPEMKDTSTKTLFDLDGTCEDQRNKPLPLSPAQLRRGSVESSLERSFFERHFDKSPFHSLASRLASEDDDSHNQSKNYASLVSATMSGPQELSPREKGWANRLSASSRSGLPSPSSFATLADMNTYKKDDEPIKPRLYAPPPLAPHRKKISSDEWPFRAGNDFLDRGNVVSDVRDGLEALPHCVLEAAITASNLEVPKERGRQMTKDHLMTSKTRLPASPPKTPLRRSRSPVKRLMGMVKSMSTNQIPNDAQPSKYEISNSASKRRWKEFSNKVRHGFLTADLDELDREELMEEYSNAESVQILSSPASRLRPRLAVSIKSSGQSKIWAELEFMLLDTCNTFLKDELENERLSRDSILHAKRQWQARNRPQVIEFLYDQATQYDIIVANLQSVKLYSDLAENAVTLNSVLHQWKILIRELSVKTLCMPDTILRRWLHDCRRVLELLGAAQSTLAHLDRLSGLCFGVFSSAEKQRMRGRSRADTVNSHRRSASDGSQNTLRMHEQALMSGGLTGDVLAPPIPSQATVTSYTRKVTPQEQRIAQQAKARTREIEERKPFVFTSGGSGSIASSPEKKKERFIID